MKQYTVHTLWTGGLDSTARVVYLSRKEIILQPYYVIDKGRASTPIEFAAMKQITERLRKDLNTRADIRDIVIIEADKIAPDQEISQAWKRLYEKYRVGSQYDYLARYAKQKNIRLEIGIEKGDGRAQTSIISESAMVKVSEDEISGFSGVNYQIDRAIRHNDVWTVFSVFYFPLWETSKADEIEMLKQMGCEDIIGMTWFCHTPLFGKPCGHCNPCKDAYHYNLGWRIPLSNYYLWYILRPKQALKKLYRYLKKI